MDFIKKNKLYIGLAGCALILIATFLPFASINLWGVNVSVSYIDGWNGKIVLALTVASGLLLWFKKENISLFTTGFVLLFTFYDMINVKSQLKGYSNLFNIHLGIGSWLIIIGAFAAAGVVIFQILEEKGKIK